MIVLYKFVLVIANTIVLQFHTMAECEEVRKAQYSNYNAVCLPVDYD